MFRKARTWFIIEALILATHPFMMWRRFHIQGQSFEAERLKDPNVMGDCSGATIIVPIFICIYMVLFFMWAFIMNFVTKHISETSALVQIILIMVLAVLPNLWLYYLLITH